MAARKRQREREREREKERKREREREEEKGSCTISDQVGWIYRSSVMSVFFPASEAKFHSEEKEEEEEEEEEVPFFLTKWYTSPSMGKEVDKSPIHRHWGNDRSSSFVAGRRGPFAGMFEERGSPLFFPTDPRCIVIISEVSNVRAISRHDAIRELGEIEALTVSRNGCITRILFRVSRILFCSISLHYALCARLFH